MRMAWLARHGRRWRLELVASGDNGLDYGSVLTISLVLNIRYTQNHPIGLEGGQGRRYDIDWES